jgi:Tol biopolymer transport system component
MRAVRLIGVVVGVLALATPAQAAFPGINGKVAFETNRDGNSEIYVVNPNGSGLVRLTSNTATDSDPAWSPDGTKIAFESNSDPRGTNPEGDMEIFVMDADGTDPVQLTHNALRDEGPAWAPDGTMLAYSGGTDDDHLDINVMTAAGVHLETLTDYPGHDESPD